MTRIRPEILSPVGSQAALNAAIAAGADAVYFGIEHFNARERAANFTLTELPEVMSHLHLRGVKGYVAFNILFYESELDQAELILRSMVKAGVDAIIVQDLGIAKIARSLAPELAIHASTQMTITDAASAEMARSMGITRAIVARELSTKEIALLARDTELELEVFVHGALCVSYSGQCFTSASWGGRSANRGECAQACRLPYDLLLDNEPRDLGELKYLLSPTDLMGVKAIPELLEAGVVSFKIEGRLKSPEYVAATTSLYRKALDQAYREPGKELLSPAEYRDLSQVYSRGASLGFLAGTNHQTILEGTFPGHRGVFVGAVTGHDAKYNCILVELEEEVKSHDGLLFTAAEIDPQEKNGPGGRITALYDQAGFKKERLKGPGALEFERKRLQIDQVPIGARIFRTNDPSLDDRLKKMIAENAANPVPISIQVTGQLGEPLSVDFLDDQEHRVSFQSVEKLASAKKSPLNETILREKLGRLGGTAFSLHELKLDLADGLHIPISELNQLRRQAVEALCAIRARPREIKQADHFIVAPLLNEPVVAMKEDRIEVIALCRTAEQLEGAIAAGSRAVILDFMELVGLKNALLRARSQGLLVSIAPPRVTKPGEEKVLDSLLSFEPDEILVRSLGQLEYLSDRTGLVLRGDFSLNAANAITARILLNRGLKTIVPSYDLPLQELDLFFEHFPASRCELVVHQYLPMFHTEYCAYARLLSPGLGFKGTSFHDCGRPCEQHRIALKDRMGAKHPIVVDVGCRNTVFSAEANSVADEIPKYVAKGVRRFRMELLGENAQQAQTLIRGYQDVLAGKCAGAEVRMRAGAVRRLGVLRVEG